MILFWVLGFIIYGLGATLGYMTMETYRKEEPLTKLVVLKSAAKVIFWPLYLGYITVIKGISKVIPLPLKAFQRVYRFWVKLPDE